MDSDDEYTKSNQSIIARRLSRKRKYHYLDDIYNDCLIDSFITIYRNSIWCIRLIYELFSRSFWQVFLFTKEEIHHGQGDTKTMNSMDVTSLNNSAKENYSEKIYRELPHYHLSMIHIEDQKEFNRRLLKSNSHHSREKISSKMNLLSNKTRVIDRSLSNQNLNRSQSNPAAPSEQKNFTDNLGTMNLHIIVAPVNSSNCQNMTLGTNLVKNHIDFRKELADTLCCRSHEPLPSMNTGTCCNHYRSIFFPCTSNDHLKPNFPSSTPQKELNNKREMSQKSKSFAQITDENQSQHSSYTDERLSTGTMLHKDTSEQNHSVLSFSDHESSSSEKFEAILDNYNLLTSNAQMLVDDSSIQNAQEKYTRLLGMSTDQNPKNSLIDKDKEIIQNKPKSVTISDELNTIKSSNENQLCEELCNKLNLSDSNQITEIINILSINAPHILKEKHFKKKVLVNDLNANKDEENNSCRQLLLHPPFKTKRLIQLCSDGTIQVLSAVDDNSNENKIINQQQYHLNYSNSAVTPGIQQNHIFTDESSLCLEYETASTALLDLNDNSQSQTKTKISFDHFIIDQSSIVSVQQKTIVPKYDTSLGYSSTHSSEVQLNTDHSKIDFYDHDPVVMVDLDLQDETIEINNIDDNNSLPEIFFRRIIARES
ncbi:unnamed protein product [Rotaria magnacalcarata]|uniref:Uncharacterized protein n=2 Tax=Rotaria magnacalcarata TaxID=392030 RepID=A0A8S2QL80_9BILA|nr:unnamed protein product [Rotaria magnacalcarata]